MARLGYVGFAADLYGAGNRATTKEEATALMTPLVEDRAGELKRRLLASLDAMKRHDLVDASRTAVIGYCFGGLCAIDLARSAPDLRISRTSEGFARSSVRFSRMGATVSWMCAATILLQSTQPIPAVRQPSAHAAISSGVEKILW